MRNCENLWKISSKQFKDLQKGYNCWERISAKLKVDVAECKDKWRYLRDITHEFQKRKDRVMMLVVKRNTRNITIVCLFYLIVLENKTTEGNFDPKTNVDLDADNRGALTIPKVTVNVEPGTLSPPKKVSKPDVAANLNS